MRHSLRIGKLQPESFEEFQQLNGEGNVAYHNCRLCGLPFTPNNTETAAGWRETQISATCETCFDAIFADKED